MDGRGMGCRYTHVHYLAALGGVFEESCAGMVRTLDRHRGSEKE